jgi:hypothetical protein
MRAAAHVHLGHSQLGAVRHVCAFFSSEEEAYEVLLPFVVEGFASGDRAIHVVGEGQERSHADRLNGAGIDVAASVADGQLQLRTNTDTYLVNGQFDQGRMLAAFQAIADGVPAAGYPMSRIICNMDWAYGNRPHHDDLVEFEARVNSVWESHSDVVICVYDVKKLSGDMVIDIIRTHPMMLIGHSLRENPFFTPPDQFLRERRAARAAGS